MKCQYRFDRVAPAARKHRQHHPASILRRRSPVFSIDAERQLSPAAARPQSALLVKPFALAVHLQAGAIDEKMERFAASGPFGKDGHAAATTAQRGMIRN